MSTVIRPSVSKKNPYYISKHRYYELKHFCLQYPEWEHEYKMHIPLKAYLLDDTPRGSEVSDPTGKAGLRLSELASKMNLVKTTCDVSCGVLAGYIFEAVTKGTSFRAFETRGIPCGKDMYYAVYRKFFYDLSAVRR